MSSLLRDWKKEVRSSILGRLLRLYWKVFLMKNVDIWGIVVRGFAF